MHFGTWGQFISTKGKTFYQSGGCARCQSIDIWFGSLLVAGQVWYGIKYWTWYSYEHLLCCRICGSNKIYDIFRDLQAGVPTKFFSQARYFFLSITVVSGIWWTSIERSSHECSSSNNCITFVKSKQQIG